MLTVSPAFLRYVERAREGRPAIWRLIVGVLLILVIWLASTMAALVAGTIISAVFNPAIAGAADEQDGWGLIQTFLATPAGVASILASFIGMSAGVFLAVRLLHRRPFGSVLGAEGRLSWSGFLRGFAAAFVAYGLIEIVGLLLDPSLKRTSITVGEWLVWVVPLMLLLFIQISAEELVFRGYLLQSLAARFRSVLVWGVLPGVVFTLLHWDTASLPWMKGAILVSIAAFAVVATVLVVKTGNLGASMGAHLGLNVFGILIVSHTSLLGGAALFAGPPMDAGHWTPGQAVVAALVGILPFALILFLLVHRRSPLRVTQSAEA